MKGKIGSLTPSEYVWLQDGQYQLTSSTDTGNNGMSCIMRRNTNLQKSSITCSKRLNYNLSYKKDDSLDELLMTCPNEIRDVRRCDEK